ncbi:MAG: hypothetical protein JJU35_04580 [Balneolales bacterium]|nr:hypothetical protein [Balneolales bacterium]
MSELFSQFVRKTKRLFKIIFQKQKSASIIWKSAFIGRKSLIINNRKQGRLAAGPFFGQINKANSVTI